MFSVFTKIGGASRALVPMWLRASELSGSRVAALLASGKLPRQGSCRGCGGRPGKGLAGGVHLALLLFMFLAWRCSGRLVPSLLLPRQAWPGAWGCDCPRTSKGVQVGPLLLYTDRSPGAWATYKRGALLGQAQNGARARGRRSFTTVTPSPVAPHT